MKKNLIIFPQKLFYNGTRVDNASKLKTFAIYRLKATKSMV
ncbi:hypothetical protein MICAF_2420007 [Microcystis aeruginosa PCC 9807]|uniref:Uncharacterized protein n=1 Tax=Microcystis aeruginosa PCC 9807 TaxID=1160283 RepID=I4H4U1_MICAE|nr:hypothetical protein MICAF_2420007 [Microcystis aeruginosa PCC 9807]